MFLPVLSRWKLNILTYLLYIFLIFLIFGHRVVHAGKCGFQIYEHGPDR